MARTVVKSRFFEQRLAVFIRLAKIRRRFESSLPCFRQRDHRTYAQVLVGKFDSAGVGLLGPLQEGSRFRK